MATYFHGSIGGSSSENQPSGELQTLYLMNPNYLFHPASSSHNPPPPPPPPPSSSGMIFLNSSHAPPHMRVLLPEDPSQGHLSFNYTPIDQSNNAQNSQPPPQMMIPISTVVGEDGFRRPQTSQQGLSLSLSSHQQGFYNSSSSIQMGDDSVQSAVFSSKYLRAVQELLDEVVNVGKGSKVENGSGGGSKQEKKKEIVREESDGGETSDAKRGAELTTVQRQELQMKKAKLINMLDLVEQRYRQYHNQMQIVVASFEQASGLGSAKSYTSLALKTISKQFRCIKDTISAQIKAMSKDLGEEFGGLKGEGSSSSSRLRYIDQHLRQQRALQQLGMMQHNAWRPQRGLPERAVTVLRAWLFEHFLHPYPKDSDKHMLAKQTGLTRSQVSNWFINARVRLWKPMIEEMYLEELKDQDQTGPSENAIQNNVEVNKKADGDNSTKFEANAVQFSNREKPYISQNASPADDLSSSTLSTSPVGKSIQVHDSLNVIGRTSSDMGSVIHGSPKKLRRTDMQPLNSPSSILQMDIHEMKLSENNTKLEMLNRDHVYSLLSGGQNNADTRGTGFGTSYQPMEEIGRFNSDQIGQRFHGRGSVSLTLGPPPIESHLSLSGVSHQNYFTNQNIHEFGRRLEMGNSGADFFGSNNNNSQPSHSTSGFEELSIMQSRKRFAAQLLPDYVA